MFYKQIERKRDEWFDSPDCSVRGIVAYIEQQGQMRDAQLSAIKTFLYLKLACGNAPLWQLFCQGRFNSDIDLAAERSSQRAYAFLQQTPAAVALLEYARLYDKQGRKLSNELEDEILGHADEINYEQAFRDLFYGVDYPDYLYSLPMGAGKTYLMAAFIYLDLHLAMQEPENPLFAHNFMLFAPSGKKSSILPSLRSILAFDPTWVLPPDIAAQVRSIMHFEILDEASTAQGSNIVRNPNAQKLNQHLSLCGDALMGLVAITNAEKVILDRIDKTADGTLFEQNREEYSRIVQANELRTVIAQIPRMAIFVDEVHHVASETNRLRDVITGWSRGGSFSYMLGFSGTPYLDTAEPVRIGQLWVRNTDLSNVVFHYPLTWAVDNFLKHPDIREATGTSEDIIRAGLHAFLDQYGTLTYANGTVAKVAIYCTSIEQLEEEVYPLVSTICAERGIPAEETVLRFHGGNKSYAVGEEARREFALLDTPQSRKRIILLVRIGQEGWDCKSLTAVILSQKNACPTNLVLQTSCRCLRQVERGAREHALIWLNEWNYRKLDAEFKKTQNTSIDELIHASGRRQQLMQRHDRREHQRIHPFSFMQMHIVRTLATEESDAETARKLAREDIVVRRAETEVRERDLEARILSTYTIEGEDTEPASLNRWLHRIVKETLGMTTIAQLRQHQPRLTDIFNAVTTEHGGQRYFSHRIDQDAVRRNIRLAFATQRKYVTEVRMEAKEVRWLAISREELEQPFVTNRPQDYYPDQHQVQATVTADKREGEAPGANRQKLAAAIEHIKGLGLLEAEEKAIIAKLHEGQEHTERAQVVKDRTYHYLPYHFDSTLERDFFVDTALTMRELEQQGLEVYYNGDRTITDFKIECYSEAAPGQWTYVGRYTPDFLLCQRGQDGTICKMLIVETKGEGYERNFRERNDFMRGRFLRDNPDFFDYLYLPEGRQTEFAAMLRDKIRTFFTPTTP